LAVMMICFVTARLLSFMAEFVPEAAHLFEAERERQGKRVLELSSPRTKEITRTTFADLYPEHSKYRWKGTRFLQDWDASSAGRSGARVSSLGVRHIRLSI
jgi:hypothetical protein